MMRFFILFFLSGLVAYFLGAFLPHWGLMVVIAVLAGLIGGSGWSAFFSAALAVGTVWLLVPIMISLRTGSELPERVAGVMGFEHSMILFVATSLVGFLLAGFSALTGNRFRRIFIQDK